MFNHWKKVIKKKLKNYYTALGDKIQHTKDLLDEIVKVDLEKMIDNLKMTPYKKRKLK